MRGGLFCCPRIIFQENYVALFASMNGHSADLNLNVNIRLHSDCTDRYWWNPVAKYNLLP